MTSKTGDTVPVYKSSPISRFRTLPPPPLSSPPRPKRFHRHRQPGCREYLDCIITGAHSLFTGRCRINTSIRFSPIAPPFNCRHYPPSSLPVHPSRGMKIFRPGCDIDSPRFVDIRRCTHTHTHIQTRCTHVYARAYVFGSTGPINHPTLRLNAVSYALV